MFNGSYDGITVPGHNFLGNIMWEFDYLLKEDL